MEGRQPKSTVEAHGYRLGQNGASVPFSSPPILSLFLYHSLPVHASELTLATDRAASITLPLNWQDAGYEFVFW